MNNLLKTIETPHAPTNIQIDYIEEYFTFEGKLKFCNLCNEFDNNISDHLKSDKHERLEKLNRNEPMEDKYITYKMYTLSQSEEELIAVSNLVIACEQAIKLISDEMHEINNDEVNEKQLSECEVNNFENEKNNENTSKNYIQVDNPLKNDDANIISEKSDEEIVKKKPRLIKGVMRAGLLANGLLMKGETDVTLVIISSTKPTESLFADIANRLLTAFKTVSQDTTYNIELNLDETCMKVSPSITDSCSIPVSCKILLTSTLMRIHPFHKFNEDDSLNPVDMLDKKSCISTLQLLRRARWFDSKVYNLPHCEAVMKILRNLIETNPIWSPISYWTLQVIVYRALSSSMQTMIRSSQALLRVFELLASGYLLNGPGLMDPCERELTNLCDLMTLQDREDITFFSQKAVRLISSRKIHQLLNLEEDVIFDNQITLEN